MLIIKNVVTTMKYEKSCGALIYKNENNKYYILMVMHVNGGHWSFPKGHVEKGETEIETALREIKEETHLDVKLDATFRNVVTYSPKTGITKDVVYFCATPISQNIVAQEEEIFKIEWFEIDEAFNMVTFDNDKNLISLLKEHIAKKINL